MLTLALKEKESDQFCQAQDAQSSLDYFCPECQEPIRKREGQKQAHFYHYQGSRCRWSKVSWAHLKTQQELARCFKGSLEQPFRSIGRIADVFCPSKSMVIEVQYSPISLEEVLGRTWDYRSIGLEILWILQKDHPIRSEFGPSGALFHLPHYFCDMDSDSFILFDQIDSYQLKLIDPQIRVIVKPKILSFKAFHEDLAFSHKLWQRYRLWPFGLSGDFLQKTLALQTKNTIRSNL
jgi:competence protein CoiA